jgi:glycosyltransferase involved in cell wall biosynthesis
MSFSLFWAAMSCILVGCCTMVLAAGGRKLRQLDEVDTGILRPQPMVTVIVPACNEEENIERAVVSLLAQDYSNLEILVVNDRSIDGTAGVLKGLQVQYPQLAIHEITDLPEGWLGKSHALAQGAELANGEYLLFTDADVIMQPTTISRAIGLMVAERLDHLALTFENITSGWLLNCLILEIGLGLFCIFRPWAARNPQSSAFIGVGAFNLVKRSAYQAVGGHESIKMHPVDDLMLGKILKEHGFRQDCLLGRTFVAVPWYNTVGAMIDGLQKNVFSLVHYRVGLVFPMLFLHILMNITPVWGMIFSQGTERALWVTALLMKLLYSFFGLLRQRLPVWYLPGAVLTPYIVLYIILRSVCEVLRNGGITWRGRHYPLNELKKSRALIFEYSTKIST